MFKTGYDYQYSASTFTWYRTWWFLFDTSGLRHATSIMERSYSDCNLYERHFQESSLTTKSTSTVRSLLVPIMAPSKMKTKRGKSASVIHTSHHNLQIIEEKERKKSKWRLSWKKNRKDLEKRRKKQENAWKGKVSQKQMKLTLFCFRVFEVGSTALWDAP